MALQLFSTGDHENPGFVEKVKQMVFPYEEGSNLDFPHARFIQNALISAQTYVECLRSNNVNFYDRDDVSVSCKVATLTGPNRARIQSVYAFKPTQKCKRVHYEQKGVGAIWCFANSHGCCAVSGSAADIVFQSVMTGAAFCDQDDLVITENGFLCSERIWAKGTCDRIYLASMFPCDYRVAVHWEGIKQHWANTDLITDDEELLNVAALYLEGQRLLWFDRDLEKHKAIMRKPEGRGDWGGTYWQELMEMKHRCREERRLRRDYLCDAIFDDNALVDACSIEPGVVVEPDGCGVNQYELDGECVDCETPSVTISASDESINLGESVTLSWHSIVPDIASSVVTVEYGSTITAVTRNAAGELVVSPTEDTTYTIRAVTVCGNATFSAMVEVTVIPPCVCPDGLPDCLQIDLVGDPAEIFLNCFTLWDGGGDTRWDGTLPRISDCRWGYDFPNDLYMVANGPTNAALSVIVELIGCDPFRWQLTFTKLLDTEPAVVWQGECEGLPYGPFLVTYIDGCDDEQFPSFSMIDCVECTKPVVRFDPPSGSVVNFPTLAFIHSSIAGGAIWYGIDEEPINTYTGPISLSAGQVLKARAIGPAPTFCLGDIATATYTSDTGLEFAFICDAPQDKAGVFDEFAPNGEDNDYHWRIKLTRGSIWIFRNAKIYETDAQGVWVTGQAWATINPIFPIEMTPNPFSVYPMVLFRSGSQLNFSYVDPIGPFSTGLIELHAYGQPAVPLTGYFRLEFTLDEGGSPFTIYKLIPHFCAPPPPCPIPSALLATADCTGAITLTGNTDIGFSYRLYKATLPSCGSGVHALVEEFIATQDDFIRVFSGVNDCSYSYFLSVYCTATDAWVDAAPVSVTVPPPCEVETQFCNHTPIIINAFGPATPYASTITVAGRPGNVVKATVYLYGYFHRYPDDVEILLVGPDGTAVLLMNDVGGFGPNAILTPGINLVIDDAAAGYMPDQTKLLAGSYKPTAYGPGYIPSALPTHSDGTFLQSPAPAGPYNQTLAAFIGKPCNGAWKLFVNDDQGQDGGAINGGWCLLLDES